MKENENLKKKNVFYCRPYKKLFKRAIKTKCYFFNILPIYFMAFSSSVLFK